MSGREKSLYKRAISFSHKMKIAKLETEILMEFFDKPSNCVSVIYLICYFLGVVRIRFAEATEHCISEPTKS